MSSVLSLPLSSLTPTPPMNDPGQVAQPVSGPYGAGGGVATSDPNAPAPQPAPFSAAGIGMGGLTRNPQLPQHPLGAYTDSQYEAQVAQLKFEIAQRYNDVLQQLGYTDDNGNFVPGQVETEANRQRSDLGRNMNLADEQTTQQAQQQGTLFSGLRGTAQARAEFPFAQAIGQLGVDVPKKLADLYGQAGGLVNEFTVRHNLLLADAAQRAAANLANNQAAGGNVTGATGGPGGGTGTDAAAGAGGVPTLQAAYPTAMPGTVDPTTGYAHPVLEHAPGIPIMYPPAPAEPRPMPAPGGAVAY